MRDILVVFGCGFFMIGLVFLSLDLGRGPGHRSGFTEWFSKMAHIQKADEGSRAIGDKMRENNMKLRDDSEALRRKMDDQRMKMRENEERMRQMQERNRAQMERLRNR